MNVWEIIKTKDGSDSLYVPSLNESYHSIHGALTESQHVFIDAGLKSWLSRTYSQHANILELGLGTGLNVWLTIQEIYGKEVHIHYTALEPYPLPKDIIETINYPTVSGHFIEKNLFYKIHESEWEENIALIENLLLLKLKVRLEDMEEKGQFADIVYYDAFAPNKQPELWTEKNLGKIVEMMRQEGVFVTYCAKGALKRMLKKLGLTVETLPGPPGKKEMVRAWK